MAFKEEPACAEFIEQVEELQVVIFNRLEPATISISDLDISMHLASSDLLYILQMFVDKANAGDVLLKQTIAPWVLESKLSGLVAKVQRTYQREYRKYSQSTVYPRSGRD